MQQIALSENCNWVATLYSFFVEVSELFIVYDKCFNYVPWYVVLRRLLVLIEENNATATGRNTNNNIANFATFFIILAKL